MYSTIKEDAKELLKKVDAKKISITRTKLSDKIDIRVLRALNNSILETQINGENALYFSGKILGEELVQNYDGKFMAKREVLAFLKDLFKKLMLGILKETEEENIIKVDECAFCRGRNKWPSDKEKKCYFLAGFISGVFSEALNQPCAVKEISCRYNGDPYCVFEIIFSSDEVLKS